MRLINRTIMYTGNVIINSSITHFRNLAISLGAHIDCIDVAELLLLAGSSFRRNKNREFLFHSSFLPVNSSLQENGKHVFHFLLVRIYNKSNGKKC